MAKRINGEEFARFEEVLDEALTSPDALPSRMTLASFFRRHGADLLVLRRVGYPVADLVDLVGKAGWTMSPALFSSYMGRYGPKGADVDIELRVRRCMEAKSRLLGRAPAPRPAAAPSDRSVSKSKAESRREEHRGVPEAANHSPSADDNASTFPARPAAPSGAPSPKSEPEQGLRAAAAGAKPLLPGVVQGVRIDRTELYEGNPSGDTSMYVDGRPPWDWVVEACALNAHNKANKGVIILRNGMRMMKSLDWQARVLGGLVRHDSAES